MVTVTVQATDGGGSTKTWSGEIDPLDRYVIERLPQAGGDVLLAATLASIYTLDLVFPPRQDLDTELPD